MKMRALTAIGAECPDDIATAILAPTGLLAHIYAGVGSYRFEARFTIALETGHALMIHRATPTNASIVRTMLCRDREYGGTDRPWSQDRSGQFGLQKNANSPSLSDQPASDPSGCATQLSHPEPHRSAS